MPSAGFVDSDWTVVEELELALEVVSMTVPVSSLGEVTTSVVAPVVATFVLATSDWIVDAELGKASLVDGSGDTMDELALTCSSGGRSD